MTYQMHSPRGFVIGNRVWNQSTLLLTLTTMTSIREGQSVVFEIHGVTTPASVRPANYATLSTREPLVPGGGLGICPGRHGADPLSPGARRGACTPPGPRWAAFRGSRQCSHQPATALALDWLKIRLRCEQKCLYKHF